MSMSRKIIVTCTIALMAGVLVSTTVFAFNTRFMRDAPISAMSETEFDTMIETFHRALDEAAENETVQWGTPGAAHGTVTPTGRFTESGLECRSVKYESFAGGFEGSGSLKFCLNADGEWKILSESS